MIRLANIALIAILVVIALLIGGGYLFFYKRSAQKRLTENNIKTNLPTPYNFILITLLIFSFIGNIFFMLNIQANNKIVPTYSHSMMGPVRSEYKYIEDEVIQGLRYEYTVIKLESNDFVLYYAKIIDVLKDQNHFLPNYIIYIKYIGEDIIGEDYHIKRSFTQGINKSAFISQYKTGDVILVLSSTEAKDLEIEGEIKYFKFGKDFEGSYDELFNETETLYEFNFKLD